MARFVITCPKTGETVDTGMRGDRQSLESNTFTNNAVRCPHCGETHTWSSKDAQIEDD